ncbi:MAG TPA: chemotaxis protein CheW [Terriglobales bacterium]|jgi:purine-binding chemotaxis protein CheW
MATQLVAFTLDEQQYALPLHSVRRVTRSVEITALAKAPTIVLGIIDLQGEMVPVISMRQRLGFSELDPSLTDQMIIAETAKRSVALLVNSVTGVIERKPEEITAAKQIVPEAKYVEGMARLGDGILFIYNLDNFLSAQEQRQLGRLLARAVSQT